MSSEMEKESTDEVIPKKDVEIACIEIKAMTTESGMIRSELVLGVLDRMLKGGYR